MTHDREVQRQGSSTFDSRVVIYIPWVKLRKWFVEAMESNSISKVVSPRSVGFPAWRQSSQWGDSFSLIHSLKATYCIERIIHSKTVNLPIQYGERNFLHTVNWKQDQDLLVLIQHNPSQLLTPDHSLSDRTGSWRNEISAYCPAFEGPTPGRAAVRPNPLV